MLGVGVVGRAELDVQLEMVALVVDGPLGERVDSLREVARGGRIGRLDRDVRHVE